MSAAKAIGVAATVLGVAALAAFWQVPALVAEGRQAGTEARQTEKQKVEKPVVTHSFITDPLVVALEGGGPRLGVRIRDIQKEDLAKLKVTAQNGVVIDEVMDESAAQKAGVKSGDVVVQFDGESVRSAQQFTRLVRETAAGRTVKMAVMRDGRRMDLDVTPAVSEATLSNMVDAGKLRDVERQMEGLQDRRQQFRFERRVPGPGAERMPMPPGGTLQWKQEMPTPMPGGDAFQWFGDNATGNFAFSMGRGRLGVTVQELTPELAAYFGVKDGLLVSSVQADTPAAKAGIKAGDVIASVNGKDVASSAALIKELADKDGEVAIGLTRDKKAMTLKATLEARKPPARRTPATGRPA